MEADKEIKKMKIEQEREKDRMMIRRSMEDQQKIFEIEKRKHDASNEKAMRLDLENDYFIKEKKEKDLILRDMMQKS